MTNVMLVLRSGGDFSLNDVLLLSHHIHKHNENVKVYCLYDKVDEQTDLVGVTLLPLENKTWDRWWCKMNMFSPTLKQYRPFLYMDLDTAIVSNLEGILPPVNEDKFITLGGFNEIGYEQYLLSGLLWFGNEEKILKIWDAWNVDTKASMEKHIVGGDQEFIKDVVKDHEEVWQHLAPNKIFNFKPIDGKKSIVNKKGNWSARVLDEIPEQASVICFHGRPRIPEAAPYLDWVNEYVNYK